MAINSLSTGFRPGVCTSSTRPTAPYEGQVIYETDTDLSYVWGGAAWQQVSGGTAVGNSGLVFVKSQTIGSAVSSVTVSDAFSATYDNYKIILSGGVGSTTGALLNMTLGSTVTGYYWAGAVSLWASSSLTALQGSNTASWSRNALANTNSLNGEIELFCPNLAKRTIYNARYIQNITDGNAVTSGGFLDNATQYTAFTFTPASGTITGGTISVYGYRLG